MITASQREAIAARRREARTEQDLAHDARMGALLGVSGELVSCRVAGGRTFHRSCVRGWAEMAFEMLCEPTTPCTGCGRPVGDHDKGAACGA